MRLGGNSRSMCRSKIFFSNEQDTGGDLSFLDNIMTFPRRNASIIAAQKLIPGLVKAGPAGRGPKALSARRVK